MFKVMVMDSDREEHEYENVQGYSVPNGCLRLAQEDGSETLYAVGAWWEATVERVPDAQVKGDYQV